MRGGQMTQVDHVLLGIRLGLPTKGACSPALLMISLALLSISMPVRWNLKLVVILENICKRHYKMFFLYAHCPKQTNKKFYREM